MLPFDIEKHGSNSAPGPWRFRRPPHAGIRIDLEGDRTADPRASGFAIRAAQKVVKIAFLDGLDESYNEAAYEKMLYYGGLLHDTMGRGWFKYRVDGGYSRPVMERIEEVELWVCHTVDFNIDDVETSARKAWIPGSTVR